MAVAILITVIAIAIYPVYDEIITSVQKITDADILFIDPGHGGIDGGAESAMGVSEKNINLAIALQIKEFAEADGWKVVMSREEDKGLYDREKRAIRSLKTQDILARKEMIQKTKPLVAVSIHLNSFKQDRSVRGAQTFYPQGNVDKLIQDESKKLAEIIQEQLITDMADGTDRIALGKRDLLLFKNPIAPIVVVECGFLSNSEEAKLLEKRDYQKKLAQSIYRGILKYTGKEKKEFIQSIDSRG
jgi:N-acetylmuramoyl-L-alanine amidase